MEESRNVYEYCLHTSVPPIFFSLELNWKKKGFK
jgi:hypothetical protein